MSEIKNVVFDLGGVIVTLDNQRPIDRFKEIGVEDADKLLDPYEQKGIFLELENGKMNAEEFRVALSKHTGKELTMEQVSYGWLGFILDVPTYKLDYLLELRKKYRVFLLSNTNEVIQAWARSTDFSDAGRPINDYFDKMYASYEVGITKPNPAIYEFMLKDGNMIPAETLFVDDGARNIEVAASFGIKTYKPQNNEDWRPAIDELLS